MTYTLAKNQGHRSVGSKDTRRVETNGETDRRTRLIALHFLLTRWINVKTLVCHQ